MKIDNKKVTIFKIRNRAGFAAVCHEHLTEGKTREQAFERMVKAVRRTGKKMKKNNKGARS